MMISEKAHRYAFFRQRREGKLFRFSPYASSIFFLHGFIIDAHDTYPRVMSKARRIRFLPIPAGF